jgi:hypothetical protein
MKINHILLLVLLVVISSVMGTATEQSTFSQPILPRPDRFVDAAHHVFVRAENPLYRRAFLHRGVYAAPPVYGGLGPHSTRVHAARLVYAPARPYARRLYPVPLIHLAVRSQTRPFYNPSLNFTSVRPRFTRRVYAAPLGYPELHGRLVSRRANLNQLVHSQPLTRAVRRPFTVYAH